MATPSFIPCSIIRREFSAAMSGMYQQEVPLYKELLDLVHTTNTAYLAANPKQCDHLQQSDNLARISGERHGAIRLGSAEELQSIRKAFAVMGMYPVGYYDLVPAGIPVHSTAFRPLTRDELSINPFRVFTSLLRVECIADPALQAEVQQVLQQRSIISLRAQELIDCAQQQGGLTEAQVPEFINEILLTFQWHDQALVEQELYSSLYAAHPLIADIASFQGPHINHLTPRTLDIDQCQALMPERGMSPKAVIEGPPRRQCGILLRQTSFHAISESIRFPTGGRQGADQQKEQGTHRARFGEIEQRGAALTPKGHRLYDRCLERVRSQILPAGDGSNAAEYTQCLQAVFADFPDTQDALIEQGLAYFEYRLKDPEEPHSCTDTSQLLEADLVVATPLVYEDFLPVSAAGIFRSNLSEAQEKQDSTTSSSAQGRFEHDLGAPTSDPFTLYEAISAASIAACLNPVNSAGS